MTAERPAGDFGTKLRAARERRGVSLRQIANATKISVGVLEALERNDISRLPGGIFSRAFVRSYALEVGLEPEETIQDFVTQFPHDSVTAGHRGSEPVEDHDAVESSHRLATTFLRLVLVSLPIAAVILYFETGGRRAAPSAPPVPLAAVAAAESPSPAAETPITQVPATPQPAEDVAADHLTVALSASRSCWVTATADGRKTIERLFQAGEQQTVEVQRELVLTAGDAGALTLTINGAEAKPFGKPGEVVTARLNLSNFKDYLTVR